MGLYIEGEMPKSCCECKFYHPYRYDTLGVDFCSARSVYMSIDQVFSKQNCPLHEIHEPHGRLIDADALMKTLSKVIDINASIEQRNEATDQERRCLWWFEQQIGIAPTILEAEEDE